MFKKIMKIIGSFILVLIILFVCIGIWASVSSFKYLEVAKPYLDNNMPAVVSWDFEELRPLLTPESLEVFETERGQKVYKMFSKLGELKSLEEPKFLKASSNVSTDPGSYDTLQLSILGHFYKGDAQIIVTLAVVDESYKFHYININSDVFLD